MSAPSIIIFENFKVENIVQKLCVFMCAEVSQFLKIFQGISQFVFYVCLCVNASIIIFEKFRLCVKDLHCV